MLNERNKANKAKKAKWEDERDESAAQGIEAADADRERPSQRQNADRYKDHAHGKFGEKRGAKKAKGAKSPIQGRLARVVKRTKSEEGKKARAKEVMKKNLMSHTVYQDMGMLMAESLGLVSESQEQRAKDSGVGGLVNRRRETPKPSAKYNSRTELKNDLATRKSTGKGFIGTGDSSDNTIAVEPGTPVTPAIRAAREKYNKKVNTDRLKAKAKKTGKPQEVTKRKKS